MENFVNFQEMLQLEISPMIGLSIKFRLFQETQPESQIWVKILTCEINYKSRFMGREMK